ncbi:MAG TPA: MEDS domain-containing protein [Polyangiaceae bacterium]|nr:MEDS domain-containing protein [Polyangiaceae bacterium]
MTRFVPVTPASFSSPLGSAVPPGGALPDLTFPGGPGLRGHAVQFYDDEAYLFEMVGCFISDGLERGERALIIAGPAHTKGILERLEADLLAAALADGQLMLVDAETLLSEFMRAGMPDVALFQAALARVIGAPPVQPGSQLRAFGEMVDLLSRAGNVRGALRLEQLWNDSVEVYELSLLCAYAARSFHREGDSDEFLDVCRSHTHVLPTESFTRLDDADARSREISLLQQRARALEGEVRSRKRVEESLRHALEQRRRAEAELRAALEREREVLSVLRANDAFKEVFMGMLGHDLRNPLNTILTTARLMTLRAELAPDSQKRLERVVGNGVRMQRMIEQILDMTRDRLATGIGIVRSPARDLVPLVSRSVEEIRLLHPRSNIELFAAGPCLASVDADRFEQVVSNLLGNAATHGDSNRPITVRVSEVSVAGIGPAISLSVRNYGVPIAPGFLPLLFDPFRRDRKPEGRSEGLGLGLYISERIVRAHGGAMLVTSCALDGTRFEAIFPRNA